MAATAELVNGECLIYWEGLPSWGIINIHSVNQDWPLNTHLYLRWAIRNTGDQRSMFFARLRGIVEGDPPGHTGLTPLIPLDPGEFGVGDMEVILGGPTHDLTLELSEWDQIVNTYEYKVGYNGVPGPSPDPDLGISFIEPMITIMILLMMMNMMTKMMDED